MKRILLTLLVGASLSLPVLAQDTDSTPPTTPPPHHHGPGGPPGFGSLTPAERQELFTDRKAAFQANPDFATQEKALHEQEKALQKQIDAAIVQADPNAAAILAKLHAGEHRNWKHKDGSTDDSTPSDATN